MEIRYARSGDVSIAYQVVGDGPLDLVLVHGWVCTSFPGWENPIAGSRGAHRRAGGARAAPGEILVTQTVKDLVVGSGLGFEDRGSASLKGVPGEWQLLALRPPELVPA